MAQFLQQRVRSSRRHLRNLQSVRRTEFGSVAQGRPIWFLEAVLTGIRNSQTHLDLHSPLAGLRGAAMPPEDKFRAIAIW